MDRRWPIVVGITAISGGIAWFALRNTAGPPSAPNGSGSVAAAPGSGKAAINAPLPPALGAGGVTGSETSRPALPEASESGESASSGVTFASQQRDAAWAAKTESEIKRRFASIRGAHLESTECRQDECQIVVLGTQREVSETLAAIEEPRGLHGFADSILLTAPEQKDGKLVLRAYAKFVR